jgi:hypothetical protein
VWRSGGTARPTGETLVVSGVLAVTCASNQTSRVSKSMRGSTHV